MRATAAGDSPTLCELSKISSSGSPSRLLKHNVGENYAHDQNLISRTGAMIYEINFSTIQSRRDGENLREDAKFSLTLIHHTTEVR